MSNDPAVLTNSIPLPDGRIDAAIYFDPATGAVRTNPAGTGALEITNTSSRTVPVTASSPTNSVTVNVPTGFSSRSVAQLAAIGLTNRNQVAGFSITPV
jgi:hypothetical protein